MQLMRPSIAARSRRGSAMIAALLVVFAVATLSLIHIQLDLAKAREQRSAVDSKRAFYMAEAGLAEAFNGIVSGKSGNVGTPDEPARFANGVFFTSAHEEGLGRVTLTSTGLCGAGRATLAIVIERSSNSIASMGFFGDEAVTIEAGALVDSYDSRQGPYRPSMLPVGGPYPTGARVGSNQSLTVGGASGSTSVYGDARPGPAGILVRGNNTTISGSTAPFLTSTTLPPIVVPDYPQQGTFQTSLLRPLQTVAAGERAYDLLRVKALTKMIIKGPARIVVQDLVVDSLGELAIDTSEGPVSIYVTDWVGMKSGSRITTGTGDPRSVSLLVTASAVVDQDGNGTLDQPVSLAATGSFSGTIYAPDAAVSIPSSLQVFGAATGKQLTIKAGAKMHFDTSLQVAGEDEEQLPELIGWRLVELPSVGVVKLRYDALSELLRGGVNIVNSATAHFNIGVLP